MLEIQPQYIDQHEDCRCALLQKSYHLRANEASQQYHKVNQTCHCLISYEETQDKFLLTNIDIAYCFPKKRGNILCPVREQLSHSSATRIIYIQSFAGSNMRRVGE